MKKLVTLSVAFLAATGSHAQQQASPSEQVVSATAPVEAEQCELRVFPTLEAEAFNSNGGSAFGLVGALIDAAASKGKNESDTVLLKEGLAPPQQVKAFSSFDLAAALRLSPSNVIFEEPLANPKTSLKSGGRLTAANASCYVELVVTQNLYTKSPVVGRSLTNSFILRDFRSGKPKASIRKGRGGNSLKAFPPETTYMTEEAAKDLQDAFVANLKEFAVKIK
jgi:hypothetical protein